jgi:Xaa-Pro aminopeptidase
MKNLVEQPLSVMLKDRRVRLVKFFDDLSLDVLWIEWAPNLRFLGGFSGSEGGLILLKDGSGWFVCDSRYTTQASEEVQGLEVVEHGQRIEILSKLAREYGWRRIGFESAHTTVAGLSAMSSLFEGAELVSVGVELDTVRNVKDAREISLLEDVATLASDALQSVLATLVPGVVESELALELEIAMRRRGAEGRGFDFIVASGVRGAMPHGRASSKKIVAGELVTIDFGAVLNGYHSDETVTFAVGEPDTRQREIHDLVKTAHDLAIEAVRPGISCRELDAVARQYLENKGVGEYFGHGLGHGVGLEIHEKPVISPRSQAVVLEGMVFTIEPGVYIPGWGGVRIEDTVVVTADGCRVITKAPKELLVV